MVQHQTRGAIQQAKNQRFNQKLGLVFFVIYSILYAAFVLSCAFAPGVMEWRFIGGLNVAICYGFGLIAAALVLAVFYGVSCRQDDPAVLSVQAQKQGDVEDTET